MADLARVVAAQVEEGDGSAIGIPVRQDGELPLTQLRLKRPATVVKESEALAKSAKLKWNKDLLENSSQFTSLFHVAGTTPELDPR